MKDPWTWVGRTSGSSFTGLGISGYFGIGRPTPRRSDPLRKVRFGSEHRPAMASLAIHDTYTPKLESFTRI